MITDTKQTEALDRMAENARELGLDYEPIVDQVEDSVGMGHKAWDMVDPKELAKEFHKALADPPCKTGSQCTSKCQQCEQPAPVASPHEQQEPVAWAWKNTKTDGRGVYWKNPDKFFDMTKPSDYEWTPLYTSPPASKPWVGLTNQELIDLTAIYSGAPLYCAIEAKLKEKNA